MRVGHGLASTRFLLHDGLTLISYRAFRNTDPPHLVDVWRRSPPARRLAQPLTPHLIEELVLSKPYFDPEGLIVATEDDRPIGFVHVGFGPNEQRTDLSSDHGAICMLLVHAHEQQEAISAELLARGEAYLRGVGAKEIYAGGVGALCPFYLGLYGGSELPGVLDSDPDTQAFFREHGYEQTDRVDVYQRELAGFRPVVDRYQMQVRRSTKIEVVEDATALNWWEACTMGCFSQTRVELLSRKEGTHLASAKFWSMEPFTESWGVHALGLVDVAVVAGSRQEGHATYLLGEAIRQLHERGFTLIEGHAVESNTGAIKLLNKLGFQLKDSGAVLCKR